MQWLFALNGGEGDLDVAADWPATPSQLISCRGGAEGSDGPRQPAQRRSEIANMLIVTRLVASLGVVILAARQRMWWYTLVCLALLGIELSAVISALCSEGPWVDGLLRAYLVMMTLATLGWVAGHQFRAGRDESMWRREVLELPFLHPAFVFVEFLIVFPIALAS